MGEEFSIKSTKSGWMVQCKAGTVNAHRPHGNDGDKPHPKFIQELKSLFENTGVWEHYNLTTPSLAGDGAAADPYADMPELVDDEVALSGIAPDY